MIGGTKRGRESILIVDDDESTSRTLSLVFGRKGYDTCFLPKNRGVSLPRHKGRYNVALLDKGSHLVRDTIWLLICDFRPSS